MTAVGGVGDSLDIGGIQHGSHTDQRLARALGCVRFYLGLGIHKAREVSVFWSSLLLMAAATTTTSRPHPFGRRLARPPSRARTPSSALTAPSRELRARGDSMCGALKRARHVIARVSWALISLVTVLSLLILTYPLPFYL